jgi:hypothetical protein
MAQVAPASRPVAEAGKGAMASRVAAAGRSRRLPVMRCSRERSGSTPMRRQTDFGGGGEEGAHREWLSAGPVLGWRRVIDGRPEEGSRTVLKWTSRFVGVGRSLWPCWPGQRVDGEGRH